MIDTHTHLCDARLADEAEEIIAAFDTDGIEFVVEVGCDVPSSEAAAALAAEHARVYAAVGTHPEDADKFDEAVLARYKELCAEPKVVAVGEIGLDYHYSDAPCREVQRETFVRQLRLAAEVKLPVILHIRDAFGEAVEILEDNADLLKNGVLMHCFGGSAEMVKRLNKLDCYYAFGGVVTFKNVDKSDVVRAVPPERLLAETDCPYSAPVPCRGRDNRPSFIKYTLDKIAEILGVSRREAEELTSANAKRLFGIGACGQTE